MNKFLVLTAIAGNKCILRDPIQKFDNCDYLAFVDTKFDVNIWNQKPLIEYTTIDNFKNRRNAKIYKILSSILFNSYEYIIWCDGNKNLNVNPESILQKYGDGDLYFFKHPERNCIYREIHTCCTLGLDDPNLLKTQAFFYASQNMPEYYGLFEVPTFIKKVSEKIMKFDLMWWEQILKFSSRDQCSLNYCLWKMKNELTIKTLEGCASPYAGVNSYFYQH
jgi:hypothetical protein